MGYYEYEKNHYIAELDDIIGEIFNTEKLIMPNAIILNIKNKHNPYLLKIKNKNTNERMIGFKIEVINQNVGQIDAMEFEFSAFWGDFQEDLYHYIIGANQSEDNDEVDEENDKRFFQKWGKDADDTKPTLEQKTQIQNLLTDYINLLY